MIAEEVQSGVGVYKARPSDRAMRISGVFVVAPEEAEMRAGCY